MLKTSLVLALGLVSQAFAAQSRSAAISVTVRPAVSLAIRGNVAEIKIRLNAGTGALVWRADQCAQPAAQNYPITQSGVYSVPLSSVEGTGARLCLASPESGLMVNAVLPPAL